MKTITCIILRIQLQRAMASMLIACVLILFQDVTLSQSTELKHSESTELRSSKSLRSLFEKGVALYLNPSDMGTKEKGLQMVKEAADSGQVDAETFYGILLSKDVIMSGDKTEAAKFLLSASKSGHATARLYLGELFLNGEGIPQDVAWGCYYITLALNSGQLLPEEGERAKSMLDGLAIDKRLCAPVHKHKDRQ